MFKVVVLLKNQQHVLFLTLSLFSLLLEWCSIPLGLMSLLAFLLTAGRVGPMLGKNERLKVKVKHTL